MVEKLCLTSSSLNSFPPNHRLSFITSRGAVFLFSTFIHVSIVQSCTWSISCCIGPPPPFASGEGFLLLLWFLRVSKGHKRSGLVAFDAFARISFLENPKWSNVMFAVSPQEIEHWDIHTFSSGSIDFISCIYKKTIIRRTRLLVHRRGPKRCSLELFSNLVIWCGAVCDLPILPLQIYDTSIDCLHNP